MKKYIAPEVEIKRFAVENIMNGSEVVTPADPSVTLGGDVADAKATNSVSYNELFGL